MQTAKQLAEEARDLVQTDQFSCEGVSAGALPDDVFAVEPRIESTDSNVAVSWHSRLPRITSEELGLSLALSTLPFEFCYQAKESVLEVLSLYSISEVDQVSLSLTKWRESDLVSGSKSHAISRVTASLVCQSGSTPFNIDLDAHFAIALVDLMLGGSGEAPNRLRDLTAAELAVIEFLFLSVVATLNQRTAVPLVQLQTVGEPQLVEQTSHQRGIAASFPLSINGISTVVHANLPALALKELSEAEKLMKPANGSRSSAQVETRVDKFVRMVPDLCLTLLVGQTDLTVSDLELLERGDVMVIERPTLSWRNGNIDGSLRLRVGDGDESLILGSVAGFTESSIKVSVDSVTIGESREVNERLMMQEDTETEDPTMDSAIDEVMLTVRVELAARRLRLGELVKLRSNQVIDLGCSPTDPVDLVVDGRRVASGELIDIEGRLGVRIKQVSTQLA